MSANIASPLFLGRHHGKLDERNRLTIPAAWRDLMTEPGYVALFDHARGNIRVYPPDMVSKLHAVSSSIRKAQPELSELLDQVGADAAHVSCDKAGRLLLGDDLLKTANITKEVHFVGSLKTFVISSDKPKPMDADAPETKALLAKLAKIFPTDDLEVPEGMTNKQASAFLHERAESKSYAAAPLPGAAPATAAPAAISAEDARPLYAAFAANVPALVPDLAMALAAPETIGPELARELIAAATEHAPAQLPIFAGALAPALTKAAKAKSHGNAAPRG